MATVTHVIRSYYDPKTREKLERETGQLDEEDPWVTESAQFGRRRLLNAPRFVAASGDSAYLNNSDAGSAHHRDISSWYSELNRSQSHTSTPSISSPSVLSDVSAEPEKPNRKNWFIMKALGSQEQQVALPKPTLADYLARDPPPLPHEQRFKPPVWLALGPTNKGYEMLERNGWIEGEALGRSRSSHGHDRDDKNGRERKDGEKPEVKVEKSDQLPKEGLKKIEKWIDEDICEIQHTDVIDLTDSNDEEDFNSIPAISMPCTSSKVTPAQVDNTFTALLTPIATALKSDRLGIGLKAKTIGPHRASQKRITHNAAALARHIRDAEEAKRKRERDGRGRRGHERRNQREETRRKEILAYLNS